ncbi:MAG: hypothetical protein D6690_14625 [Nitrospirae bacterium]|nr:MAG: hypothetical protein D6690_14625 [Nitrospirota bacterium]
MKWEAVNSNQGWSVRGEWPGISPRYLAQLIPDEMVAKLMADAPAMLELLRDIRPFLTPLPEAEGLCRRIDRHLTRFNVRELQS